MIEFESKHKTTNIKSINLTVMDSCKIFSRLRVILFLFMFTTVWLGLDAQVTVGDGTKPQFFSVLEISTKTTKGGLRMPHLTSLQRNDIKNAVDLLTNAEEKATALKELKGLTIYNLTTNCIEYWKEDAGVSRWISLCSGNADISFDTDPFSTNFDCVGGNRGPIRAIDSQGCTNTALPFTFQVIVGSEFITLSIVDQSTGQFGLSVSPNPTTRVRTGIIRVTNNCTKQYKDFILVQNGCIASCDTNLKAPELSVSGTDLEICSGGSAFITITNPGDYSGSVDFIWTKNDIELTGYRGKLYCNVSEEGNYRVYIGSIGCDENASKIVTVRVNKDNNAPQPISITASNNGVLCNSGRIYILTASGVPAGTSLVWYKNGVEVPSATTNPLTLTSLSDIGFWSAVAKSSNGCISVGSNEIEVTGSVATALPLPELLIDGQEFSSSTKVCKNGTYKFELSNTSAYSAFDVTISWYYDNNYIGTGAELTYTITRDQTLIRCVVKDNTEVRCSSESIMSIQTNGTSPSMPVIGGNPVICGITPTNLSVGYSAGYTYQWYKDGVLITGANSDQNIYAATDAAVYTVKAINTSSNQCESRLSAPVTVVQSDVANLTFSAASSNAKVSTALSPNVVSYKVINSVAGSATSYKWALTPKSGTPATALVFVGGDVATGGKTITTTTDVVQVLMGEVLEEDVELTCTAENSCGTSAPATHLINVVENANCIPLGDLTVTMSPASGQVFYDTPVVLTVTASSGSDLHYVWKRNGVVISNADDNNVYRFRATDNAVYSVEVTGCDNVTKTKEIGTTIVDLSNIASNLGPGIINGQRCFDINVGNTEACGSAADRITANFSNTFTYNFVLQTDGYTTYSSLGYENLRWQLSESDPGEIVDWDGTFLNTYSVTGRLNLYQNYPLMIKFKESLFDSAKGRTRLDPMVLTIYGFTRSQFDGAESRVELRVEIRDCNCLCGAYISPGVWKEFHCFNLGVTDPSSKNPFTPGLEIFGDYYPFAGKNAGARHGAAVESATPLNPYYSYSHMPASAGAWKGVNGGANNPCGDGFRIPTPEEWKGIMGNNNLMLTPGSQDIYRKLTEGLYVGHDLFLPAQGRVTGSPISNAATINEGAQVNYWTNEYAVTPAYQPLTGAPFCWSAMFTPGNGTYAPGARFDFYYGYLASGAFLPVRCIKD